MDIAAVQIWIFPCQRIQRDVELKSVFVLLLAYKNKLLQKFRNFLIIHYQSIPILSEFYCTSDRRTYLSPNVSHFLLPLLVKELEFERQAMNLIESLKSSR